MYVYAHLHIGKHQIFLSWSIGGYEPLQVLGTELWSSITVLSVLNCWEIILGPMNKPLK